MMEGGLEVFTVEVLYGNTQQSFTVDFKGPTTLLMSSVLDKKETVKVMTLCCDMAKNAVSTAVHNGDLEVPNDDLLCSAEGCCNPGKGQCIIGAFYFDERKERFVPRLLGGVRCADTGCAMAIMESAKAKLTSNGQRILDWGARLSLGCTECGDDVLCIEFMTTKTSEVPVHHRLCFKCRRKRCHECGLAAHPPKNKFPTCAACKVSAYCSRRCQSKSWKAGHKSRCEGNASKRDAFSLGKI